MKQLHKRALPAAIVLGLSAFLFHLAAFAYGQDTLWEERQKALKKSKEKTEKLEKVFTSREPMAPGKPVITRDVQVESQSSLGIQIPEGFGTVVESWSPRSSTDSKFPLVVHIQDAHGVYEAQKNASEILKILTNNGGPLPMYVYVEGAWDRVMPEWMSVFPDEQAKADVSESLLRQGEITGEEYFVIMEGPGKIRIEGIEDREIYEANLKSRQMMDKERENVLKRVAESETNLQKIKQKTYPKELFEFDWVLNRHENGKMSLKEYITYLRKNFASIFSSGKYENLKLLLELFNLEQGISVDSVDAESKNLINQLSKELDKRTLTQLAEMSLKYRLGQISGEKYYQTIKDLGTVYHIPVPHIEKYIVYLKKAAEIHHEKILDELQGFERETFETFRKKDPNLTELIEISMILRREKKFWDEKLSPQDWEDYKQFSGKKGIREVEQYIRKASGSNVLTLPAHKPTLTYSQMKFLQEAYYKLAFKRDQVLADHLIKKMESYIKDKPKDQRNSLAVLIAGGFHTPGMMKILRDKGISYLVVRPKLSIQ